MIDAIQLNTDGTMERAQVDEAGCQSLQDIVGGYIQAINPDGTNRLTFWMNEEGKLHGLPVNDIATSMWWNWMPHMERVDFIVGPVVITGGTDDIGNTLPVPEEMYAYVEEYIKLYTEFRASYTEEDQ